MREIPQHEDSQRAIAQHRTELWCPEMETQVGNHTLVAWNQWFEESLRFGHLNVLKVYQMTAPFKCVTGYLK